MTKRADLPASLLRHPFTTGDALLADVTRSRLRASDLDASYWGVRSRAPLATLRERCLALQARMPPESFISHSTAAMLHGAPVPWRLEADRNLHVSVPSPMRAPHANAIRGHRTSAPYSIVNLHGVRVSDPARTWCDLATQVPVEHLVAAGDYLVHWRHPIVSLSDLMDAVATATNRRGYARLAASLPLLDDHAESAPESLFRVLLLRHGFTGLVINRHVEDRFGEFVARTDIRIPRLNVVLEYMGDYHRTTAGQWRSDMSRRARLETTGLRVMEVNADDLKDPAELVARIRKLAALATR